MSGRASLHGVAPWPSFVLAPSLRVGSQMLPHLHHPSPPRPAAARPSASALAAWRAARRAALVGMHATLAPWRGRGAPRGARYLLCLRGTAGLKGPHSYSPLAT